MVVVNIFSQKTFWIVVIIIVVIFVTTIVVRLALNETHQAKNEKLLRKGVSRNKKAAQNQKESIKKKESTNILFAGDVMLDRYNRVLIERKGADFFTDKIKRLFWSQDVNVVNLEGPITDNESVSVGTEVGESGYLKFTFDAEQTKAFLRENRIDLVNIGNNHILNFGPDGLQQTKDNLRKWKVDYFGDPTDTGNYVVKKIGNKKVAFVSYNGFAGPNVVETVSVIKKAKGESDTLIVYAHWGSEYKLRENEKQKSKARKFVDAGADIIIGAHPHVTQPIEIYKNKPIFYSLGNFVFDQYFSENVKKRLLVGVSISDDSLSFRLVPVYMEADGSLRLMNEEEKKEFLKRIADNSTVDNSIKSGINKGEFSIEFVK